MEVTGGSQYIKIFNILQGKKLILILLKSVHLRMFKGGCSKNKNDNWSQNNEKLLNTTFFIVKS